MGIFDSVYVDCPHCGKPVEFQSKEGDPYMNHFTLLTAPDEILRDILNWPNHCETCDGWFALLDQRYPIKPPRPSPIAVKVKTPEFPKTHPQGMKWWPDGKDFSVADLETPAVTNGERASG